MGFRGGGAAGLLRILGFRRRSFNLSNPSDESKRQNDCMTVGAAEQIPRQFDEDSLLARRFLSGDKAAFDAIYRRYFDKVYAVARGILLDHDDALDSVQETFALVLRNLPRFSERSKLGTWIFRIAVNTAIQQSRRLKHRKRQVPLTEALDKPAAQEEDRKDEQEAVARALSVLSSSDRAVLSLFYWEDMALTDIADSLGCTANAAKTRLFRARERFREAYEALEKHDEEHTTAN